METPKFTVTVEALPTPQPDRYTITIFEENGVMHFHSADDWGEYRKRQGLDPGVAVECSASQVEKWARGLGAFALVQHEMRETFNKAKAENESKNRKTPSPVRR